MSGEPRLQGSGDPNRFGLGFNPSPLQEPLQVFPFFKNTNCPLEEPDGVQLQVQPTHPNHHFFGLLEVEEEQVGLPLRKPDNILLADCSEFSTARVIDFGLACLKTEEDAFRAKRGACLSLAGQAQEANYQHVQFRNSRFHVYSNPSICLRIFSLVGLTRNLSLLDIRLFFPGV